MDHVPYMANQNFRMPYNRKPTKTALLPRTFQIGENDAIQLDGPASTMSDAIDEELLWKCHPALAQPTGGYVYLVLELPVTGAAGKKRRTGCCIVRRGVVPNKKRRGSNQWYMQKGHRSLFVPIEPIGQTVYP